MIVGKGAIAKALTDRDDRIYFASGVSNSKEDNDVRYILEKIMLCRQTANDRRLVYFSSLSIFNSDTKYSRHKMEMEGLVKVIFPKYAILRIGNIEWAENPHQLIPFIKEKLKNKEPFDIFDEYRFILSRKEFDYWIDHIPDWNCEMNITGEMIHMRDLVKRYDLENE